jgi:hypothetical protein
MAMDGAMGCAAENRSAEGESMSVLRQLETVGEAVAASGEPAAVTTANRTGAMAAHGVSPERRNAFGT